MEKAKMVATKNPEAFQERFATAGLPLFISAWKGGFKVGDAVQFKGSESLGRIVRQVPPDEFRDWVMDMFPEDLPAHARVYVLAEQGHEFWEVSLD